LSGRELFISERTVAQHLTTIFNKLSVNTRAQAVAVATQRGLLQTTLAVPRAIFTWIEQAGRSQHGRTMRPHPRT
jgi:hypothetical protein